jgi:hypothetical protein
MVLAGLVFAPRLSASSPSSLLSTTTGSEPAYAVVDCFSAEPLALRDEASKEEGDESLEIRDSEEDRGVKPGRCCDVM